MQGYRTRPRYKNTEPGYRYIQNLDTGIQGYRTRPSYRNTGIQEYRTRSRYRDTEPDLDTGIQDQI